MDTINARQDEDKDEEEARTLGLEYLEGLFFFSVNVIEVIL